MSNATALLNIGNEHYRLKIAEFMGGAMSAEQSAEWNAAVEAATQGFVATGYAIDRAHSDLKSQSGDDFADSAAGKIAYRIKRAARGLNEELNDFKLAAMRVGYAMKWGMEIPDFSASAPAYGQSANALPPHSIADFAP